MFSIKRHHFLIYLVLILGSYLLIFFSNDIPNWLLFSNFLVIVFVSIERHFDQKLSIFYTSGRYFITNGRDLHVERSRFSCWSVEIFMMNGRDFHDERSTFSCWTVEIFMLNGRDVHDKRSSCSRWTVEIFMMNGQDFHVERSKFSSWTVEIFTMKGQDFHNDRTRIVYCLG